MAKIGRNDPCPCGSGKKYKQCHGPIDAAHESEQRHLRRGQETLIEKIMESAPSFAGEFAAGINDFWNGTLTVTAIDELDDEERGSERFLTWFMFDHRGDNGATPLERLAADPSGLDLGPAEATLLPAWTNVRLQPYRVTAVHKGQGLTVQPLWNDMSLMLEDQAAARHVEVGEILIVHLTPAADVYLVAGAAAHLTADTAERVAEYADLHLSELRQTRPEATYDDLVRERSAIFNHLVMALPREAEEATHLQMLQELIDTTRVQMTATVQSLLHREPEEPERLMVPQASSEETVESRDQDEPDTPSIKSK